MPRELASASNMTTLQSVATKDFYSPGSLLNVALDTKSPLAYGMPEKVTIWSEQSPAWDVTADMQVAKYPTSGVLASGWLLGEKYLAGKAALLDVPKGQGLSSVPACVLNIERNYRSVNIPMALAYLNLTTKFDARFA